MKKTLALPLLVTSVFAIGVLAGCSSDENSSSENSASLSDSSASVSSESGSLDSETSDVETSQGTSSDDSSVGRHETSGEGVPSDDSGEDGDYYVDTVTGDEYEKQNGRWVKVKEGENLYYTVHFDLNGGHIPGTNATTIPDQLVSPGHWVSAPEVNPVKDNYEFKGWLSDINNSNSIWTFTFPVYGNLVLTASYRVSSDVTNKFSINIDPKNGDDPYTVETFAGDNPAFAIPSKENFAFVGWYWKENGQKYPGYIEDYVEGGWTLEAHYEVQKFNFQYQVETNGEVTITGLLDIESVSVSVPATINGRNVTKIGQTAFQSRIYLESVTLPSSIKEIDSRAFNGAGRLLEIKVDPTNAYYEDVDGILFNKGRTELLRYPCKKGSSYTVPNSVQKIGDYAFYGYADNCISSIFLNEGLQEIGAYAFYRNELMTNIVFPSSLRRIGDSAFSFVTAQGVITQVSFNDGLEYIGDSAFVGQYFKDTFTLPSTVKHIGSYAFANCTAIKKFVFPRDLEELGENVFSASWGLLEIDVESGNTHFKVQDNMLFDYDMSKVLLCPSGQRDPVEIPDSVTEIGDFAFFYCDDLVDYTLPTNLQRIGKRAFAFSGIKEIDIPNSVTELGEEAFASCYDLERVTFGSGLSTIPVYAFDQCYHLTTVDIPGNIQTIENSAFWGCSGLTSVTFKEGLKEIQDSAFYFSNSAGGGDDDYGYSYDSGNTPGLKTVTFPNSLETLGRNVFANQSALTSVTFGTGLKNVSTEAFSSTGLVVINVPDENEYFSYSNNILYNKNKTEIYLGLDTLTGTLTMPNTVTKIGDYAFYHLNNITGIVLSNQLEEIGSGAFAYTKAQEISFPASLRLIKDGAFYMGSLKSVTFEEGVQEIQDSAFVMNDMTTLALPNSLQTIGPDAFNWCSSLLTVTFGTGLKTIEERAFSECRQLLGSSVSDEGQAEALVLPSGLETLGDGAFAATKVADFAFAADNANFKVVNGMILDQEEKVVYAYASGNAQTSLELPSTVTEIRPYAFAAGLVTNLTSLKLSENLEKIGQQAFANCVKIGSIVIPMSVTTVERRIFANWGANQLVYFECSEDYALANFDPDYLGSLHNSAREKVTYDYHAAE